MGGVGQQRQRQLLARTSQFGQLLRVAGMPGALETGVLCRQDTAALAIADGEAGAARQLLFERIKQMDQGDVGMTGQLEQLLFTGCIKIMEVADNKDRAT